MTKVISFKRMISSFRHFLTIAWVICVEMSRQLKKKKKKKKKNRLSTLGASPEAQNFVRPHVSTFLKKYWCYCFDKHINLFMAEFIVKRLHSENMPNGNVMTLWVRPGALGALLQKTWSFLVPGEATKPNLFSGLEKSFQLYSPRWK